MLTEFCPAPAGQANRFGTRGEDRSRKLMRNWGDRGLTLMLERTVQPRLEIWLIPCRLLRSLGVVVLAAVGRLLRSLGVVVLAAVGRLLRSLDVVVLAAVGRLLRSVDVVVLAAVGRL